MPAPPLRIRSSNKAAALIIVLALVVLVTGLTLAYFSRTTNERQLGQSSYNNTSADLLARSALDIVVGDFKEEIANGSTATSVSGTTIYVPINALNMVPQRSGDIVAAPNLIRRSVRSDGINFPGVASRASAVNSTSDQSANGRSISTTRWNEHFLLPLGSGATIDNPSPIPSFTSPDWVIVTRSGPTPCPSWNATLADPTSNKYAIGRYAYAVYDEGGLLEINIAGYPVPPTPLPAYATDVGRKGVLAFAELKAVVPTPTPSGTPVATKIVGFRNYATTGQNNVTNLNFSFTNNSQIFSFVDYFLGAPIPGAVIDSARIGTSNDFGTVRNVLAADGRTDQSFVTRAALINYFKSANMPVNMLQYLGTFSREQNKPSLPLTPVWPFTRVVVPQRFYLGNLNLAVYPSPTSTPIATPTPTGTPTLTPTQIQTALGLQFASANTPPPATPTPTPTPGPCDLQVRWKYVGNQDPSNTTPLSAIPAFPSNLTTLDFFQYINYALFGVTTDDSTDIPFTLGIGAALIDQYDVDALNTGIYYGSSGTAPCDAINACQVYGPEQTGPTVRWAAPTGGCVSPPTGPDSLCNGCGDGLPSVNQGIRSVGEFGWAYSILNAANNRNSSTTPKYLIDFKDAYNPNAGLTRNPDPALLDFFTYNSAPVRSGVVSLNTRQPLVLAALFQTAIFGGASFVFNPNQATIAANSILNDSTNGTIIKPAMSRADIARFGGTIASSVFGVTASQDRRDSFARVLSEVTQTRTWGLLIDVVAQTGHYKPNATGLADFVVEGEKRYWLHVAIDRFDGSIVGQRLEEVTE